jgi:hypothetical protein
MIRGSGDGTVFGRNLKALKDAWALGDVNDDDEQIYDVANTDAFAKRLEKVGHI